MLLSWRSMHGWNPERPRGARAAHLHIEPIKLDNVGEDLLRKHDEYDGDAVLQWQGVSTRGECTRRVCARGGTGGYAGHKVQHRA
eukprot:COSAG01_NODE_1896_length_8969_cov_35.725028_14_plen_85_part_00